MLASETCLAPIPASWGCCSAKLGNVLKARGIFGSQGSEVGVYTKDCTGLPCLSKKQVL